MDEQNERHIYWNLSTKQTVSSVCIHLGLFGYYSNIMNIITDLAKKEKDLH